VLLQFRCLPKKECKLVAESVLVIEDDPAWQKSFIEIVNDAGYKAVITSAYDDALVALSRRSFALAVVDISLAFQDHLDRGGVDFLKKVADGTPPLPCIVVTCYGTIDLAIETLAELGAVHFFRKEEFDRREFIQVVKQKALLSDILMKLSERECQVLALLSEGLTNQQIADKLFVSINTIKKHVQSIYTKLDVNSRAAAVAKSYGQTS
jgi:DNA-binding NarL/FixJ family response regulator